MTEPINQKIANYVKDSSRNTQNHSAEEIVDMVIDAVDDLDPIKGCTHSGHKDLSDETIFDGGTVDDLTDYIETNSTKEISEESIQVLFDVMDENNDDTLSAEELEDFYSLGAKNSGDAGKTEIVDVTSFYRLNSVAKEDEVNSILNPVAEEPNENSETSSSSSDGTVNSSDSSANSSDSSDASVSSSAESNSGNSVTTTGEEDLATFSNGKKSKFLSTKEFKESGYSVSDDGKILDTDGKEIGQVTVEYADVANNDGVNERITYYEIYSVDSDTEALPDGYSYNSDGAIVNANGTQIVAKDFVTAFGNDAKNTYQDGNIYINSELAYLINENGEVEDTNGNIIGLVTDSFDESTGYNHTSFFVFGDETTVLPEHCWQLEDGSYVDSITNKAVEPVDISAFGEEGTDYTIGEDNKIYDMDGNQIGISSEFRKEDGGNVKVAVKFADIDLSPNNPQTVEDETVSPTQTTAKKEHPVSRSELKDLGYTVKDNKILDKDNNEVGRVDSMYADVKNNDGVDELIQYFYIYDTEESQTADDILLPDGFIEKDDNTIQNSQTGEIYKKESYEKIKEQYPDALVNYDNNTIEDGNGNVIGIAILDETEDRNGDNVKDTTIVAYLKENKSVPTNDEVDEAEDIEAVEPAESAEEAEEVAEAEDAVAAESAEEAGEADEVEDVVSAESAEEAVEIYGAANNAINNYIKEFENFVNQPGIDSTSKEYKNHCNELVDTVMSDETLSASDKITFLNSVNSYDPEIVKSHLDANDLTYRTKAMEMYTQLISESLSELESGEITINDLKNNITSFNNLTEIKTPIFNYVNSYSKEEFNSLIDNMISLFKYAQTSEDISTLNDMFDIGSKIQIYYSGEEETNLLKELMSNIDKGLGLSDKNNRTEEQTLNNWEIQYGEPGPESFAKILKAIKNGDFNGDSNAALKALLHFCNNDTDTLVDYFREKGSWGIFKIKQDYLPIIMSVLKGIVP